MYIECENISEVCEDHDASGSPISMKILHRRAVRHSRIIDST
jgi:hypothetical protein